MLTGFLAPTRFASWARRDQTSDAHTPDWFPMNKKRRSAHRRCRSAREIMLEHGRALVAGEVCSSANDSRAMIRDGSSSRSRSRSRSHPGQISGSQPRRRITGLAWRCPGFSTPNSWGLRRPARKMMRGWCLGPRSAVRGGAQTTAEAVVERKCVRPACAMVCDRAGEALMAVMVREQQAVANAAVQLSSIPLNPFNLYLLLASL